jgi:hypothetical protein
VTVLTKEYRRSGFSNYADKKTAMKKRLLLAIMALACYTLSYSQLLTWTPEFAKEGDNITITVDATKGNQVLLNYAGDVYVHIGLITSASTNQGDWK